MFGSWSVRHLQLGKVVSTGNGYFLDFYYLLLPLFRSFRRLVGQGEKLTRDEFVEALQDIKMDCTQEEAAEIFAAFDTDGKGYIDMKEFLFQLRVMSLVIAHTLLDGTRWNVIIDNLFKLDARSTRQQMF